LAHLNRWLGGKSKSFSFLKKEVLPFFVETLWVLSQPGNGRLAR
jgi:hypothetical protein